MPEPGSFTTHRAPIWVLPTASRHKIEAAVSELRNVCDAAEADQGARAGITPAVVRTALATIEEALPR